MDENEFLKRATLLKARDQLDFVTFTVFTLVTFVIGTLAMFDIMPLPKSLNQTLQPLAHYAWAFLLMVGSPLALFGRIRGALETEAGGCLAIALAFLTYVFAILGNNLPSGLVVAAVFGALVVKYGYRGYVLASLARKGTRSADS